MKQFCVGPRKDVLKKMISAYKYDSARACGYILADLICSIGAYEDMVIVPLPTISRHIRERGFDHTMLLAKNIAKHYQTKTCSMLERASNTVQVGASKEQRIEQAKTAYAIKGDIDRKQNYLLVDDVWTTGSSMLAACDVLKKNGCKNINVAVIAKSG